MKKGDIEIIVPVLYDDEALLTIQNLAGAAVFNTRLDLKEGINIYDFERIDLPKALYLITVLRDQSLDNSMLVIY